MADNTTIKDATASTVTVASDDIGGVQYQRVKVTYGADGVATDATSATPLPVALSTDLFGAISTSNGGPSAFYDLFDAGTVDTSTRWNTYGTVTPTSASGTATLPVSTTASATSVLSSIPTFPMASGFLIAVSITIETAAVTGNHRFWGLGQVSGNVGTSAAPITDGVGFEVDTSGVLRASVYAAGTRTFTQTLTYPTAGSHIYFLWVRGDITFWAIDSYNVPLAQSSTGPQVQNLPLRFASLNSATPSAAPTMSMVGLHVSDLGGTSTQLSDGAAPWRKAQIGKSGAIAVKGALPSIVTASMGTTTGTAGPCDVSEAGNVTFTIKNTVAASAFGSGGVVVFEQSDDNVSWAPLMAVRADTNLASSTHILGANAASASMMFDAACEGINWVRARLTTGVTTNGATIVITPGGMGFNPGVALLPPSRSSVNLYASGLTAGTTATEAAVTMSQQKGTAAATSATSFVIPNGKTFRIQSITLGIVGNATATAATIAYRLRINTAGAVATTSNLMWTHRLGVPATASVGLNQTFVFGDGMDIPGNGTLQYGLTILPTFVTNAPTYDITVTGYEF